MTKKVFPKTIYITHETYDIDGKDYLNVREDVDSTAFEETTPVAVYQLVEVGQVKVTREYESRLNGKKKSHRHA